jgi:hypothetical protein
MVTITALQFGCIVFVIGVIAGYFLLRNSDVPGPTHETEPVVEQVRPGIPVPVPDSPPTPVPSPTPDSPNPENRTNQNPVPPSPLPSVERGKSSEAALDKAKAERAISEGRKLYTLGYNLEINGMVVQAMQKYQIILDTCPPDSDVVKAATQRLEELRKQKQ